jgi:hypothetical protein
MSQQISLRVHSVKCIDETNGAWAERFGNDEIWLGGYTISANGDTQVIAPWEVYAHFDDGDVKVFEPPRVFHTFALAPVAFPQELGLGLVLVEKDNGGMAEAIKAIAKLVSEHLKAALARRQSTRPQPGLVGTLAVPLLKWALSEIGPVVAAEVKRRIIAAYNDDVFQPQHVTLSVPSPNMRFSGSMTSARSTLRFRDHDGIYELTYDWQVAGMVLNPG